MYGPLAGRFLTLRLRSEGRLTVAAIPKCFVNNFGRCEPTSHSNALRGSLATKCKLLWDGARTEIVPAIIIRGGERVSAPSKLPIRQSIDPESKARPSGYRNWCSSMKSRSDWALV